MAMSKKNMKGYSAANCPGTKKVLHKGKSKRGKPGIGKPHMSGKAD